MTTFLTRLTRTLRMVTHAVPYLLTFLLSDLLLTLTLPLKPLLPLPIYNLNSHIAHHLWLYIHKIFLLHRPTITHSGAFTLIPPHENALIVANHVSWSDFYLVHALAIDKGMLGRCRYFAKRSLMWVPLLGWGFLALGMPLVGRSWASDEVELERLFGRLKRDGFPMWLISYSEGTRFSAQKHASMTTYALSRGKPHIPTHCLLPRTKGFVSSIRHLRDPSSHIQHVYDLTLAYQYTGPPGSPPPTLNLNPPSIFQIFARDALSPPWRFHVHMERFAIKDLPLTDEGVAEWLEGRWAVKDEVLKGLKGDWIEWEGLGEVGYFGKGGD